VSTLEGEPWTQVWSPRERHAATACVCQPHRHSNSEMRRRDALSARGVAPGQFAVRHRVNALTLYLKQHMSMGTVARVKAWLDRYLVSLAASLGTTPSSVRAGLGAAVIALALHAALLRAKQEQQHEQGGSGAAGGERTTPDGGLQAEGTGQEAQQRGPGRPGATTTTRAAAVAAAAAGRSAHLPRVVSLSVAGVLVSFTALTTLPAPQVAAATTAAAATGSEASSHGTGSAAETAVEGFMIHTAGCAAVARLLSAGVDVYLITLLPPTHSTAAQADAVNAALGAACGLPQEQCHRCLTCTTAAGALALARQLAADAHVEACGEIAQEMARLRLPHVNISAGTGDGSGHQGLCNWVDALLPQAHTA